MAIDVSSSAALVASVQHSIQIVKALFDTRDGALEREKTVELREKLFTVLGDAMRVQTALSAAQEEIANLKARVMKMEKWESEKARYELREVVPGRFAYAIRETERGLEPPHRICAQCYERGIKSILQEEHLTVGRTHLLVCHSCKADFVIKGLRQRDQ